MTKNFENMLYLFGAGAVGATPQGIEKIDVEAIRNDAIDQGIWPLVYIALSKICDIKEYHPEFLSIISASMRRKEFTLRMIQKLENAGIECCILKGVVVAELYSEPECRISGDTDILIHPKDEKKVKKILEENSYILERRNKNNHHLKATHPIGGLLEVHVRLYSYTTEHILFNGLKMYGEPYHTIFINGEKFHTLGLNDHLMYLTAHYIKHLINRGGGVRQMMDLLLYMKKYENEIDFVKYEKLLKELKYDKLIDTVQSIGAKYFGFDYPILHEVLMEELLNDTEEGGIFGFSTVNRNNFHNEYCRKRTDMSQRMFTLYWWLKSERSIFNRVFPNRKQLIREGYACANHCILLPVAWILRIGGFLKKKKGAQGDLPDESGIEKRLALMRDFDMID